MKIIKRHRSGSGMLCGYTILDGNVTSRISVAEAVKNKDKITNAILLKNGEFRAKKGETIETVVDYSNLGIVAPNKIKNLGSDSSNTVVGDCYGKEYINVCRKIRGYARAGKIVIEKRVHIGNNGKNLHLFKLIEACGISVDTFIQGYLSVLQPYSLAKFKGENLDKTDIWFCDIGYKVKLLIKINDRDSNKPIVVSFHESNLHDKNKLGGASFNNKHCAVIIEGITAEICNTGNKIVKYVIQRGFIRLVLESETSYVNKDLAIVQFRDIERRFNYALEELYTRLYSIYIDDAADVIPTFELRSGKLSFLSHGYSVVNNLSILIDLYSEARATKDRIVIVTLTKNLIDEVPEVNKKAIKDALLSKFGLDYKNKLYSTIIDLLTLEGA